MELILLIIGGILTTAIIYMIAQRLFGHPFDDGSDTSDYPGYDEQMIVRELQAFMSGGYRE
ncbi:hypothetical protein ACJ5NV_08310 [Loktanella agnita]|uniref:hypothetical protein n=1 Tax=Loktanella agnita TaxID=287097 RepID=UPI003985795D